MNGGLWVNGKRDRPVQLVRSLLWITKVYKNERPTLHYLFLSLLLQMKTFRIYDALNCDAATLRIAWWVIRSGNKIFSNRHFLALKIFKCHTLQINSIKICKCHQPPAFLWPLRSSASKVLNIQSYLKQILHDNESSFSWMLSRCATHITLHPVCVCEYMSRKNTPRRSMETF